MMKGFVAYSKADSDAVSRLMVHLKSLEYEGLVETWYDGQLVPGDEWDKKIQAELSEADVIIFCVSADLLATDYVQQVEIPTAISRRDQNEAIVIPIIFGRCSWKHSALGKLQAFPAKGDTVQDYSQKGDPDRVWEEVTISVRDAIKSPQETRGRDSTDVGKRAVRPEGTRSFGAKAIALSERGRASDLEQDDFTRATFSTISDYFEASLENLKRANRECETRLQRALKDAFEASVYVNGQRRALCGVFVQNRPGWAGIGYSTNGVGDRNSFNESLSLARGERGARLKWQALMGGMHGPTGVNTSEMDPAEASRHLWSLFIQHL